MRMTSVLVLATIGTSCLAQQNPFVVFPLDPERQVVTAASYVRRPDNANQAEQLQSLNSAWFRGIGDSTSTCSVRGFYHWAADENVATAETYGIILRLADPSGAPDATPAGVITSVPGLTTPTNAAGGRGSFIMTDVFATPVTVPCSATWFQGIAFPANPNWPATDGHSLWAADSPAIGSPATVGENHRLGAPFVNWKATPALVVAPVGWTSIMGVLVDSPNLHMGGMDPASTRNGTTGGPNFGMNGLFPDISGAPRVDGIYVRIQDNVTPSGIALVAASTGYFQIPLPFAGIAGHLYLDPNNLGTVGFGLMTNGAAVVQVAAPATLPPSLLGLSFMFQSVIIDPVTGAGKFTNAQTTLF
jgi:hypothetical protein